MVCAFRIDDRYEAGPPEPVGDVADLLNRLRLLAGEGPVMIGFDFPIGVPVTYARRAGVYDFLTWLPQLGIGKWVSFYNVAELPEEISTYRPFYPFRPGGTSHQQLFDALEVEKADDILRRCELPTADRPAASSLFWTLGPKAVGKAAIVGWRDVLEPGLRDPGLDLVIWPFSGRLDELLKPGCIAIVETYPTEFHSHLGVAWSRSTPGTKTGKGSQSDRAANARRLLQWAAASGVDLKPALMQAIQDGFGSSSSGGDQFDATIGLFGMLNILLKHRRLSEPESEEVRKIEGWIFGQRAR